jgi:L-alanine-DL-glutamate epimerase-like enolase superfamily enzyme
MGYQLTRKVRPLALKEPFRISGHVFETVPVLEVELREGDVRGEGEAAGIYYRDDLPPGMAAALDRETPRLEAGITRDELRRLMPPGGARNAVDCALWDLESKKSGKPVWQLVGLAAPRPRVTTFTIGAEDPAFVMRKARETYAGARALKLKLTGETDADIERVRAARRARPEAWIGVDANQGFTPDTLEPLVPVLLECGIALLEQPFRRGREADMEGLDLPLPTAADESCLDLAELETLPGRFDMVNIKLDKCGGLTEGLAMARRARELGLEVMVGNMVGTSLAMAPAFVLGQLCDVVDLDGPVVLVEDRVPGVVYRDGAIWCPPEVWGARGTAA